MFQTSIKIVLFFLFASLNHSDLTFAAGLDQEHSCVQLRMALDIGSGSSKIRSGIVNTCTQHLIVQIAKGSVPIAFKDHLSAQAGSDKNFSNEFMGQAKNSVLELIERIKAETYQKLSTDEKFKAYSYLLGREMEVSGIATEAFRQARNGVYFIWLMSKEKVRIQIIPQTEEGHLGFLGALSLLSTRAITNVDPDNLISWDIGGGSMQIVAHKSSLNDQENRAHWLDFGNQLASNPMRTFVLEKVKMQSAVSKDRKAVSPNPILNPYLNIDRRLMEQNNLEAKVDQYVQEQMKKLLGIDWWQTAIHRDTTPRVYGIGGVHNGILSFLRSQKNHEHATGYSIRDLEVLLDRVLVASDKDLVERYGMKADYAIGTVTNILLVKTVMKTAGINYVEVLDVDNSLGVMIAPKYWLETIEAATTSTEAALGLNP